MKTLFWVIGLFALAVGLVVAARYNDGYVLIVLPPYRIEIALNLLLVALAAGFVVLYSIARLVFGAVQMPARVRRYRLARRRERGQASLLSALQAYFEGRYAKAEQAALQSIELGEHERLSAVLAARAAHELRAYDRRDRHLERAMRGAPEDDPLRIVTQAELLLEERRPEDALGILKALPRKHTAALRLELRGRQQTRGWDHVAALVTELEKRKVFEPEQAEELRAHAIAESIRRRGRDVHALDELWKKLPEAQKRGTLVAAAAAQAYVHAARGADAQAIVEHSLDTHWDSTLVALYPQTGGGERVRQIERAERWLVEHSRDGALLLALGRLCARQALWGKAQSYLEAAVAIEPTYDAHLELARLHEKLGNAEAARRHYRESLERALAKLES